MKKAIQLILVGLILTFANVQAQVDISYYLPEGMEYDASVPTPKSVIDHEVGDWHVTHDKLVHYYYHLAEASDRVKVDKFAYTYEHRPLLNVIITSPENHSKLEQLRSAHLKISDPNHSGQLDLKDMPVVIRLGYSVHGNESSGANASLLVAYHLAAAEGAEIDNILANSIILIDPSLNPDGLQRFATWVNQHKSKNMNSDVNSREFQEPWPRGRTNHYWFDLNRDWLLAQHPESKGRIKLFHDWMPNVQTDHHEMGSNATFFFQPGVPSRKHPLIPTKNVELTGKIAEYHAAALDKHNRLYYTKESFDDFYFGKGSTYPDIHGGIGILFEQASVRGHLRQTTNGELTFPFAIKNQFITSLSTVDASIDLRLELLEFQRDYFQNGTSSKAEKQKILILGAANDAARVIVLGQVLLQHKIKLYELRKDVSINSTKYSKDKSLAIPLDQPQANLIKALFERRTSFKDSLFYDISAWDFDLAYNLNSAWMEGSSAADLLGSQIIRLDLPAGEIKQANSYAYAIPWDQYFAPGFVNKLLQEGFNIKYATEPFKTAEGNEFDRGTILIPFGLQERDRESVEQLVEKYARKYHVDVVGLKSGLSASGIDMGSNRLKSFEKPTIAMLVDQGVNGYEAGEVWHLLDQRYDMHVTMIPTSIVDNIKLGKYNVIVLPDGSYSGVNAVGQERIKTWVKEGGTLIAWRGALRFVSKLQIADLKFKKSGRDTTEVVTYADLEKIRGANVIGGSIFNMTIDTTHPLAYGFDQKVLPVFKRGSMVLEPAKKSVANPFKYTANPLVSGYISKENLARVRNSPAVSISTFGQGKVIGFVDNYNFRAFWYGTNRLFLNAVFFGDKISTRQ